MKSRYLILLFFLLIRFVIGYLDTNEFDNFQSLSLAGNIDKIYQKNNKCIIEMGVFIATSEDDCDNKEGDKVNVIGKMKREVLTNWQGKIVLEIEKKKTLAINDNRHDPIGMRGGYLERFRNFCRNTWGKFVPKKEAGLLAGIILGDKSDIGYEFYQEMVRSGSIHIVVASGYNVLLVGSVALSLLFWIWKRSRAIWGAIGVMVFYAILAGGESPVVRAVLMAGLLFVSQIIGRRSDSIWMLFLTIWVMLVWEPSMLASISFQLSVVASVGLMVIAPWVINRYSLEQVEKLGLVSTASTMLLTAPILWWNFGRFSLIGLVSNVLILPLVPPVMALGVGMLVLPGFLYLPTYALAHLLVRLIEFFGS